jgi:hypothetical protein
MMRWIRLVGSGLWLLLNGYVLSWAVFATVAAWLLEADPYRPVRGLLFLAVIFCFQLTGEAGRRFARAWRRAIHQPAQDRAAIAQLLEEVRSER